MKTKLAALSAAVLLLALLIPGAYASQYSSETQIDSSLGTGDVKISVTQSEPRSESVMPGMEIDHEITITNLAEPAWIRVSLTNQPNWLTDNRLTLCGGWERHGDYFYYIKSVGQNQPVQFITGFTIPVDLDGTNQNKSFGFDIVAEAIQSAHFQPDFTQEDPWFGTIIEACVHPDNYVNKQTTASNFEVVYDKGAQGLIHIGDDFFSGWPRLMPGDVMSGQVAIKNNYQSAKIYFRTETIADDALLKALLLKIENDGEVIYDGTLSGTTTPLLLNEYNIGDETTLTYTITVPAHLGNQYSMRNTSTRWIFSVGEPDIPPAKLPSTGGSGASQIILAGMALAASAGLIILIRMNKKGRPAHE